MVTNFPRPPVRLLIGALFVGLGWLLAGCAPEVRSDSAQSLVLVEPGESAGQTFVSDDRGLEGVEFSISETPPDGGEITFHLREGPGSATDLASASLSLDSFRSPGFAAFRFPPQAGSQGKAYYAFIENHSRSALTLATSGPEAYLNGALYLNHHPQEDQLTFRLVHDPAYLALGLVRQGLSGIGWILAGAFVFLLPGWGMAAGLWPPWKEMEWPEKLGLAGGLSLALYPLLLLWLDVAGLAPGRLIAWLPAGLGLFILAWRTLPKAFSLSPAKGPDRTLVVDGSPPTAKLPALVLVIVLVLVFGVRLWTIRQIQVPMWGDSVQHTVMAQLILDHNGLFQSWEPYASYASLSVQWGFSAASAVLAWVTGASSVTATLLAGQLINGLAVAGLYPLALKAAHGNAWGATAAVAVAGLLSPLPAVYVNWGRYAQLAGQAMLPAALWLAWEVLDPAAQPGPRLANLRTYGPAVLLGGIVLAGMLLTYYRMAYYFAAFVLALLLLNGLQAWRHNPRVWRDGLPGTVMLGITGLVLFSPWIERLAGAKLVMFIERGVTVGFPLERVRNDFLLWNTWPSYLPPALAGLALVALAISLLKKEWRAAVFALWALILTVFPAGALVRLPGANTLQTFTVLISLYMPAAVLVGWLFGEAVQTLARGSTWAYPVGAAALLLAAVWGAIDLRDAAQPSEYAYVTAPDLQAMAWIEANTPVEALFLVGGAYGNFAVVGEDAGWWLPLLAHRRNTMPPQYALLNETPSVPSYSSQVVELVDRLKDTSPAAPEGFNLLCEWGITHVYAGQRQGRVGYTGEALYKPDELAASDHFRRVYHRDLVSIFEFDRSVCTTSP